MTGAICSEDLDWGFFYSRSLRIYYEECSMRKKEIMFWISFEKELSVYINQSDIVKYIMISLFNEEYSLKHLSIPFPKRIHHSTAQLQSDENCWKRSFCISLNWIQEKIQTYTGLVEIGFWGISCSLMLQLWKI